MVGIRIIIPNIVSGHPEVTEEAEKQKSPVSANKEKVMESLKNEHSEEMRTSSE